MGLFNIFKKDKGEPATTDNGVAGPTFLTELTEHIIAPRDLQKYEWRRKLKASSGQTKFSIKYFGQRHQEYPNLVVGIDDIPALIIAVEPDSGEEILLFDGCIHGFNAMFCDNYPDEQKKNRRAESTYKAPNGTDIFEITISTYHQVKFDDEFAEAIDETGFIQLADGSKLKFETAKRNGFDVLQIFGTTDSGDRIEIVSEELA